MKEVGIRIATVHDYGGEVERTQNVYDGRLYEKDGKTILRYEESLYEGAPPVMTTLTVGEREVRLHRKGAVGGDMLFRAGEACEFFYRTGFGNLPMEIRTRTLEIGRMGEGLTLRIRYRLYTEGEEASDIDMQVVVAPLAD